MIKIKLIKIQRLSNTSKLKIDYMNINNITIKVGEFEVNKVKLISTKI